MFVVLGLLLMTAGYVYSQQTYPYISFMGQNLANHSYVNLSRVGDDDSGNDSVKCITDLETCCRSLHGSHRGDWLSPNGSRLPFVCDNGNSVCLYESRWHQRVDLRRTRGDNSGLSGIYRCDIPTIAVHNSSLRATIFIGLYAAEGGDIVMVGSMRYTVISRINGPSPQFTLTCISTGGPATNVTWTRELYTNITVHPATILTEGNETMFNATTLLYNHTLTVTGRIAGLYTCTVTNNKPSEASASRCLFVEAPPGAPEIFKAEKAGEREVEFIWSSPLHNQQNGVASNYTLSCSPSPSSLPLTISSQFESLTVTGFSPNTIYSCFLVASNCKGSGPQAKMVTFTTEEDYAYFHLFFQGPLPCQDFITSRTQLKLEDITRIVLQQLKPSCPECNTSLIDKQSFTCNEETPLFVTYRARLEGTSLRDSSSLISLIEDWVRDGASVIVTGVLMTVGSDCPVAISSLTDPQCTLVSSPLPPSEVVSSQLPSIAPSADTACDCNTVYVAGLVVVIVVLLIIAGASLTTLTVYILHTKCAPSLNKRVEKEGKSGSPELSTNTVYKLKEVVQPQEDYEIVDNTSFKKKSK